MKKIIYFLLFVLCMADLMAGEEKHNFNGTSWANGQSCLICHAARNNMPKAYPPEARIVDVEKLTPAEKSACVSHPSNILCFSCHTKDHALIQRSDALKELGTMPNQPPVFTSGSESSIGVRVIDGGSKSLDCLSCHNVHNKDSSKMLKPDYYSHP